MNPLWILDMNPPKWCSSSVKCLIQLSPNPFSNETWMQFLVVKCTCSVWISITVLLSGGCLCSLPSGRKGMRQFGSLRDLKFSKGSALCQQLSKLFKGHLKPTHLNALQQNKLSAYILPQLPLNEKPWWQRKCTILISFSLRLKQWTGFAKFTAHTPGGYAKWSTPYFSLGLSELVKYFHPVFAGAPPLASPFAFCTVFFLTFPFSQWLICVWQLYRYFFFCKKC